MIYDWPPDMTPKTITQISYLLQQGFGNGFVCKQVFSGRLNVYILRAGFIFIILD